MVRSLPRASRWCQHLLACSGSISCPARRRALSLSEPFPAFIRLCGCAQTSPASTNRRQVLCCACYNVRNTSRFATAESSSIIISDRYLGAEFPKVLAKPQVDYKQANLTVPCTSTQPLLLNTLCERHVQPLYILSSTRQKGRAPTIMFSI